MLRELARKVEEIRERRVQSNVAAASAILAGLLLEKAVIHQVLRSDIMHESVIYQEIEAEARGEARGKLNLVLRLLTRRIGTLAPETEVQIRRLSLGKLEELSEALLNFSSSTDFEEWLLAQSVPSGESHSQP